MAQTPEELEARIELLEKALTIIGMGLARTVYPKGFVEVHKEYMDHALKMVDIHALYAKYPNIAREVIYPLQGKK